METVAYEVSSHFGSKVFALSEVFPGIFAHKRVKNQRNSIQTSVQSIQKSKKLRYSQNGDTKLQSEDREDPRLPWKQARAQESEERRNIKKVDGGPTPRGEDRNRRTSFVNAALRALCLGLDHSEGLDMFWVAGSLRIQHHAFARVDRLPISPIAIVVLVNLEVPVCTVIRGSAHEGLVFFSG